MRLAILLAIFAAGTFAAEACGQTVTLNGSVAGTFRLTPVLDQNGRLQNDNGWYTWQHFNANAGRRDVSTVQLRISANTYDNQNRRRHARLDVTVGRHQAFTWIRNVRSSQGFAIPFGSFDEWGGPGNVPPVLSAQSR